MAGDVDIVIQSAGGKSFQPFFSPQVDTSAYQRAKKNRNLTRTLLEIGCGADGDLAPNRTALLAEIDKATGNQNQRIGAICLFGTSNGCGLILSLAKALQARPGTPKTLYIGLGDVTIIPFGRDPAVPDIGNLQPTKPPQVSFGFFSRPRVVTKVLAPSAADLPPPIIADPGVTADTRKNFFTTQGNRARVFSNSPAGKDTWWWTSDMTFGEVHGQIPDWTNLARTTTASNDFDHHVELCEKIAIPEMRQDISVELSKFVTTTPPSP